MQATTSCRNYLLLWMGDLVVITFKEDIVVFHHEPSWEHQLSIVLQIFCCIFVLYNIRY
jgi:hypothetical protein